MLGRRALLPVVVAFVTCRPILAQDSLPSWSGSAPKKAILEFVSKATKSGSPDFVPPAERIAAVARGRRRLQHASARVRVTHERQERARGQVQMRDAFGDGPPRRIDACRPAIRRHCLDERVQPAFGALELVDHGLELRLHGRWSVQPTSVHPGARGRPRNAGPPTR